VPRLQRGPVARGRAALPRHSAHGDSGARQARPLFRAGTRKYLQGVGEASSSTGPQPHDSEVSRCGLAGAISPLPRSLWSHSAARRDRVCRDSTATALVGMALDGCAFKCSEPRGGRLPAPGDSSGSARGSTRGSLAAGPAPRKPASNSHESADSPQHSATCCTEQGGENEPTPATAQEGGTTTPTKDPSPLRATKTNSKAITSSRSRT
jgi:hypothetical protein